MIVIRTDLLTSNPIHPSIHVHSPSHPIQSPSFANNTANKRPSPPSCLGTTAALESRAKQGKREQHAVEFRTRLCVLWQIQSECTASGAATRGRAGPLKTAILQGARISKGEHTTCAVHRPKPCHSIPSHPSAGYGSSEWSRSERPILLRHSPFQLAAPQRPPQAGRQGYTAENGQLTCSSYPGQQPCSTLSLLHNPAPVRVRPNTTARVKGDQQQCLQGI